MGFFKANNPFRHHDTADNDNANGADYAPPPGAPPSYAGQTSDYAPPPGSPPSYPQQQSQKPSKAGDLVKDDAYAVPPPAGPPPSHGYHHQQQQQHNWQSVRLPEDNIPDTSSYPPPPAIFGGHDRSWANNATEEQAREGEEWSKRYPLLQPASTVPTTVDARRQYPSQLVTPRANTFSGFIRPSPSSSSGGGAPGSWIIKTDPRCGDSCITAQPPAYLARRDDPRLHQSPTSPSSSSFTIYYEVKIHSALDAANAGLGLGFTALPYPPFRMPGWHRGSLAVHSDDGHRYVNDLWGGDDFVRPFGSERKGLVVGLGMRFSLAPAPSSPPVAGTEPNGIQVECFMTRDGRVEASWDVNGPRDAQRDLPPVGVQGYHDLVVAVGVFGALEVEVVLDPGRWVYKGA